MNWLKQQLINAFGGGAVHIHTLLVAQKKVLGPEGQLLLAGGVPLQELAATRPGLWLPTGKARRVVRDKCITTAYVTFLALMHQTDATTIGDFKYHDSGIGTGAEAIGDVGLGTPWGARGMSARRWPAPTPIRAWRPRPITRPRLSPNTAFSMPRPA